MLSRPFVPGTERQRIASFSLETTADARADESQSLPPIERFMVSADRGSVTLEWEEETFSEVYADEDELPPVEHFIDPLPGVEDFAADASVELNGSGMNAPADLPSREPPATDWGETDWQQYDWRAAAALGEGGESEASHAWAATDWDAAVPRATEPRPTPAEAIASALDQIAQRIREGELPTPGGVADPKAIAATLAALMGIRQ
jgi:hypothetical protein